MAVWLARQVPNSVWVAPLQLFFTASTEFSKWFGRGMSAQLKDTLMALEPGEAEDALFNLFAPFALNTFGDQIKKYRCSILPVFALLAIMLLPSIAPAGVLAKLIFA